MYDAAFRTAAKRLYEYFQSMHKTARALRIGVGTVWRWVQSWGTKPQRSSRITEVMLNFFKLELERRVAWTHHQLCERFKYVFHFNISRQLVSNILKRLGYTRKRIKKRGFKPPMSMMLQKKFSDTVLPLLRSNTRTIVSVDETGFDHREMPIHGYSKRGHPAIVHSCSRQHKRISVMCGVDNRGKRVYELSKGTVDSKVFANFIREMPWIPGTVLIMDNASIHRTILVRRVCVEKGYELVYCPPYSPDMNPIENVFGFVKTCYRKSFEIPSLTQRITTAFDSVPSTMPQRCFDHLEMLLTL